ncbi:MAG: hypothetical protein M1131_04695 [Actinobacteria bacterium]|nr:hypothetical protein [Actinomycetota bacterium]
MRIALLTRFTLLFAVCTSLALLTSACSSSPTAPSVKDTLVPIYPHVTPTEEILISSTKTLLSGSFDSLISIQLSRLPFPETDAVIKVASAVSPAYGTAVSLVDLPGLPGEVLGPVSNLGVQLDGYQVHVHNPDPALFGRGHPWLSLSLNQLSLLSGVHLGSLFSPLEVGDPIPLLDVEKAVNEPVKVVSHTKLSGVSVTEYSFSVTLSQIARFEERKVPHDPALIGQMRDEERLFTSGSLLFKEWVDSVGFVRKLSITAGLHSSALLEPHAAHSSSNSTVVGLHINVSFDGFGSSLPPLTKVPVGQSASFPG